LRTESAGAMMAAVREVLITAFEGVQSLDVTGPLEVFAGANQALERGVRGRRATAAYRTTVATVSGRPVRSSSGLGLVPERALQPLPARLDTLVVPGGVGTRAALKDGGLVDAVREAAGRARRVAGVCTGAFLLAEAGLLDGRRATTHWAACSELARRYPSVEVDGEPIFLRDGPIFTSAGVTAGLDLALALVEDDLGRDVALAVARGLVLFLRRPGSQAQFSAQLSAQLAGPTSLREVQHWIAEHPEADLTVPALAERASLSPRHFARRFQSEIGVTPARYVEQVRLEAARRLLEDSAEPVEGVAARCGFGTAETMRRVFLRRLGVGPAEYRRRFASPLELAA